MQKAFWGITLNILKGTKSRKPFADLSNWRKENILMKVYSASSYFNTIQMHICSISMSLVSRHSSDITYVLSFTLWAVWIYCCLDGSEHFFLSYPAPMALLSYNFVQTLDFMNLDLCTAIVGLSTCGCTRNSQMFIVLIFFWKKWPVSTIFTISSLFAVNTLSYTCTQFCISTI